MTDNNSIGASKLRITKKKMDSLSRRYTLPLFKSYYCLNILNHIWAVFFSETFSIEKSYVTLLSSDLDGLRKTRMRNAYSSDVPPDYCYLKSDVEKR